MQIAEASSLEDSTRQLAAEFLVTLCEAREKAPGMMRKLPHFIGQLFQCLTGFLLDIEVRLHICIVCPGCLACSHVATQDSAAQSRQGSLNCGPQQRLWTLRQTEDR